MYSLFLIIQYFIIFKSAGEERVYFAPIPEGSWDRNSSQEAGIEAETGRRTVS